MRFVQSCARCLVPGDEEVAPAPRGAFTQRVDRARVVDSSHGTAAYQASLQPASSLASGGEAAASDAGALAASDDVTRHRIRSSDASQPCASPLRGCVVTRASCAVPPCRAAYRSVRTAPNRLHPTWSLTSLSSPRTIGLTAARSTCARGPRPCVPGMHESGHRTRRRCGAPCATGDGT